MQKIHDWVHTVTELFDNYLKGRLTARELVKQLRVVERNERHRKNYEPEETMWFKFFDGDTGDTDIGDIERCLNLPSYHTNHIDLLSSLEIGVSLGNKIEVYYS